MNDLLKNIFFLIPIMLYYFVESMLAAIFVTLVWRVFLVDLFGVYITYFQWVAIIWIFKVIFFDVFKIFSMFMAVPPQNQEQNNNDYNQN